MKILCCNYRQKCKAFKIASKQLVTSRYNHVWVTANILLKIYNPLQLLRIQQMTSKQIHWSMYVINNRHLVKIGKLLQCFYM